MTSSLKSHAGWKPLGAVDPQTLTETRLDLHWAAQLVSAVSTSMAAPADDDSHTSLEATGAAYVFAGAWVRGEPPVRAALQLDTLELQLWVENRGCTHHLLLDGHSYEAGKTWLSSVLEQALGRKLDLPLQRHDYEMPTHSVGEGTGEPFRCRKAQCEELARWYHNADLVLQRLAARTPGSSTVRLWPHHFDMGMLITLKPETAGPGRSIGIGLSPGDAYYAEPYWYVNPYPAPSESRLPSIQPAHWHIEGWLGAVLPGHRVAIAENAALQAEMVESYLETALCACRELLSP